MSGFHPFVSEWFTQTLGTPTPAQARGWEHIRSGRHTLIAAPTGSGKTLAAFLTAIDDLVEEGVRAGVTTFADYAQWEAARGATPREAPTAARATRVRERPRTKRLGYREQREWSGMEQAIVDAEATVAACQRAAEDPAIASDPVRLQERFAALASEGRRLG